MSRIRARKTARQPQRAQAPESRALRAALVRLQSGQPDRGLAALNQLARQWTDPARQARILGLVGDYELRRGKHREAVAAYGQRGPMVNGQRGRTERIRHRANRCLENRTCFGA